MQKYCYRYIIRTNNMCYGAMDVSRDYQTRKDAEIDLSAYMRKYGACEIIKRRYSCMT